MGSFFRKFFEARPVAPVRTPPGFVPFSESPVDEVDLHEETESREDNNIAGLTIGLAYCDASGHRSQRVVSCASVRMSASGETYLRARCHLRDDWRSFRLDRIAEVTDYRTGEIISDVAGFFAAFQPAARRQAPVSAEQQAPDATRRLIERARPQARVLVHLARADGVYLPCEQDAIMRRLRDIAAKSPPIDGYSEPMLGQWLNNLRPTEEMIAADIVDISSDAAESGRFLDAAFNVIQADNAFHAGEMAVWKTLSGAINDARRINP